MKFIPLQDSDLAPGDFYTLTSRENVRNGRIRDQDLQSGPLKFVKYFYTRGRKDGASFSYYNEQDGKTYNSAYYMRDDHYVAEVPAPQDQMYSSVRGPRGSMGTQSPYGQGRRKTTSSSRVLRRSKTRKSRRATGAGR